MKKYSFFKKILNWSRNHRILSTFIILVVIIGGYWGYKTIYPTSSIPQYTLSKVKVGTITQTVSGSGQVSASKQTDILSKASGTIKSINVSVGQSVHTGDLIAVIDSTDAAISLQNAQISLAKITEPADEADISLAQNNLSKAYDSGFNTVSEIFLDVPTIMTGMKSILFDQGGYLSDKNSTSLTDTSKTYRDIVETKYNIASEKYKEILREYKNLTRTSATSSIDKLISDTYEMAKTISEMTIKAQTAVNFISSSQPEYQDTQVDSASTNVNNWVSQINSDISSLMSSQNSILSSKNSLNSLIEGSDELDIKSAQLNLEQAQRTYSNYFVRAPYDGVIGKIPVDAYEQAGSGTTIATIIGEQKIASISLNEVDAAKVKVGQVVKITFDAIDNLDATGTVAEVDQIGTVSSGVVSYGIKININTEDARIKPGMSVNTTIITLQKENVLVVSSSAIKTQNGESYVQTLDQTLVSNNSNNQNSRSTAVISTTDSPIRTTITTGDSDDTNTEILSGLKEGDYIITKTTTTSTSQTNSTPSLFSGLTGRRNTTSSSSKSSTSSTRSSSNNNSNMGGGMPPPGM